MQNKEEKGIYGFPFQIIGDIAYLAMAGGALAYGFWTSSATYLAAGFLYAFLAIFMIVLDVVVHGSHWALGARLLAAAVLFSTTFGYSAIEISISGFKGLGDVASGLAVELPMPIIITVVAIVCSLFAAKNKEAEKISEILAIIAFVILFLSAEFFLDSIKSLGWGSDVIAKHVAGLVSGYGAVVFAAIGFVDPLLSLVLNRENSR
jgi:hypothetical protein